MLCQWMNSELSKEILDGGDSNPDLASPSDELSPDEPSAGHLSAPDRRLDNI